MHHGMSLQLHNRYYMFHCVVLIMTENTKITPTCSRSWRSSQLKKYIKILTIRIFSAQIEYGDKTIRMDTYLPVCPGSAYRTGINHQSASSEWTKKVLSGNEGRKYIYNKSGIQERSHPWWMMVLVQYHQSLLCPVWLWSQLSMLGSLKPTAAPHTHPYVHARSYTHGWLMTD